MFYKYFFVCLISLSEMGEFKLGADLLKYLTDTNLLLLVPEPAITNSRDSRVSPGFQLYKVYRDVGVINCSMRYL